MSDITSEIICSKSARLKFRKETMKNIAIKFGIKLKIFYIRKNISFMRMKSGNMIIWQKILKKFKIQSTLTLILTINN